MIAPHVLDGPRLLADGGILDPLPMAPISAVNADLTIAVSLSGSEAGGGEPDDDGPSATTEWLGRMRRSTTALFDAGPPDESEDKLSTPPRRCRCRASAASR